MDAHAPGQGGITQPSIVWGQFIGLWESLIIVEPGAGSSSLTLPAGDPSSRGSEPAPLPADFVPAPATGGADTSSPNVVFADVLPDEPGREKIEFESAFAKPTVAGPWQPCVGRCFARRAGQWVQVWETERIDQLFQPLPLVGDFDADGRPEVAILPLSELVLLEAQTGRIKDRCRFTDTRSYGFFGVYDLDRDGQSEFLVQADFSKHVDVLGVRAGKLRVLWQHPIELDIANPQRILRVGPQPVADVDGDGRPEVLTTVFNERNDGRWWLTVRDGLTGRTEVAFPDECLAAAVDLDGDGASELLTTRTEGGGVPAFGTIAVRALKDGGSELVWQQGASAWQLWEPPLPSNVQSAATLGRRTVMVRGSPTRAAAGLSGDASPRPAGLGPTLAVIRQRAAGNAVVISLASWERREFRSLTQVKGQHLEALGLDARGRLLVSCRHAPDQGGKVRVERGRPTLLSTQRLGVSPGPVAVAWPRRSRVPAILVQGCGEEIVRFAAPTSEHLPAQLARLPGRGQSTSWPETRGPVVADLGGDGRRQLLRATAAPSGCARLLVSDLNGRAVWHHDFPRIPGTPPVWNTGGLILWQTGHLTDSNKLDVLVTVRRSMMHSEETCLLSGQDGRELWRRDRQVSQRAVGGTSFAIADYDGDGLDDLASLHPSIIYLMKGTTGGDLLARDATWEAVPAKPVYWGQPIAADVLNQGRAALFFAGRSLTGVIRTDGSLVWWDGLDHGSQDLPAFGRFTGRGRLEAIGFGYPEGIRCYDTATAEVLWRLAMPANEAVSGTASADLDGDGRDEAACVAGTTLFCVGATADGTTGQLRWKLSLPAVAGPPTVAALDTTGQLSILLAGADGFVYCIK